MTVEEMNPTAAEYNRLRKSDGWSEFQEEYVEDSLARNLYCVTLHEGGNVVGMGRIIGDKRLVFIIQDVIVAPDRQGRGYGRAIMEFLMAYVYAHSIDNTYVGLMAAVGKEAFYEKFDFVRRPNDRFGAGMVQFIKKDRMIPTDGSK